MRFSEDWLREWVNPPLTTEGLSHQLSMAGLEVDAVTPVAGVFQGVVVGAVLKVEPHPNADKLRICAVNVGTGEPLSIVCGAANVAAGMKVPVAMIGADLPGLRIKPAKLRGVPSAGMICSAKELGLEEESSGIMPLPEDAPLGQDIRDYLRLHDQAIEVDLTPDRGDCLSIRGIAREIGVLNGLPVSPPGISPVPPRSAERWPVQVDAPEACPVYACRVIRGIKADAQSPLWLRERLRRSGLRSIHPVVDVTNWVLLELGQPLHAFALETLRPPLCVRWAIPGETLRLLNGQVLELKERTLVIADASRPLALAGIMGGADSGVNAGTRDILLESAFFSPDLLMGKARGYGLHTDSSHRFERGVDPQLQVLALERATRLILELAGGEPGPVVCVDHLGFKHQRQPILLRRERVSRVLGVYLNDPDIARILEGLGMELQQHPDGWRVTPPSWRFDLSLEVDLIEELGRVYGYDAIPAHHGAAHLQVPRLPEARRDAGGLKAGLVARGYQEVITYSFIAERDQQAFDALPAVKVANPISTEMAVMRTSLWPGLLQTYRFNLNRQQDRMRIFEVGLRFLPGDGEFGLDQQPTLAGLISGAAAPEQWSERPRKLDFFDLKGDVEAVLAGTRLPFHFVSAAHPALHPGQCAAIERDGIRVGWLGMLNPVLAARYEVSDDVFLFEISMAALETRKIPSFQALSKFPSIRRDLAILVEREIPFERIRQVIDDAKVKILRDIWLFDVYTGANIDSNLRSYAFGLILQDSSRTLVDDEVEAAVQLILTNLQQELGAKLRGS